MKHFDKLASVRSH